MPTTSNFGWTTPADTDLVKDGAAAIRTLGNGIDTSLLDLKGGTSGQVLSKNSNTDLDYTWVTPNVGDITEVQAGVGISVASGTGPIPVITNSSTDLITSAGDILYGTAADTVARLGIGTAGQVLTVNGGATAPQWATASAGGMTLLSTTSLSSNSTTISSISTSYKHLYVVLKNVHCAANDTVRMRQNGDTSTSNYINSVFKCSNTTLSGVAVRSSYFNIGEAPGQPFTDLQRMNAEIFIQRYTDTNVVASYIQSQGYSGDGATTVIYQGSGIYDNSAAITSITFLTAGANNFDSGTVYIYGVS